MITNPFDCHTVHAVGRKLPAPVEAAPAPQEEAPDLVVEPVEKETFVHEHLENLGLLAKAPVEEQKAKPKKPRGKKAAKSK